MLIVMNNWTNYFSVDVPPMHAMHTKYIYNNHNDMKKDFQID